MGRRTKKTGTRDRITSTRPKYRGGDAAELEALDRLRKRYEQGLARLCGVVAGPTPVQQRTGRVRERMTPFAKMLSCGHIDKRQFAAGERLRADWLSIMLDSSGADFSTRAMVITGAPAEFVMVDTEYRINDEEVGVKKTRRPVTFAPRQPKKAKGRMTSRADYVLDASQRLKQVAKALPGNLYDLLIEVCGQECTLSQLAGGPWGGRAATARKFKKALDLLGDHYGLASDGRGGKVEGAAVEGYQGSFDTSEQGYDDAVRGV